MRSRFCADQSGGVAPMFALAIVPIIGLAGAALDYSRAASARSAMFAALDATGLMLSRDAATLTPGQIKAKAIEIFNAEFNRTDVPDIQVDAVLNSPQAGSFTLNVTASGNLPTTFTRVLGTSQLPLNASTDINWGIKKLELALALDNTGSMGQSGKLTELKTAAKNLLTTLKAAAKQPGDVKVSIIPFDTMVNVGTVYKDEFWIDYTVKGIQKNQWTGCVMDRDQSKDVSDTTPVAGSSSTLFPAKQCNTSLVSMMPLTDVLDETGFTNLNSKVDSMQASGNTNVTIGLAWGWHSLTAEPSALAGGRAVPGPRQGGRAADRRHQHAEPLVERATRRSIRARRWPAPMPRTPISRSTRCASSTETRRCSRTAPPSRPCITR